MKEISKILISLMEKRTPVLHFGLIIKTAKWLVDGGMP